MPGPLQRRWTTENIDLQIIVNVLNWLMPEAERVRCLERQPTPEQVYRLEGKRLQTHERSIRAHLKYWKKVEQQEVRHRQNPMRVEELLLVTAYAATHLPESSARDRYRLMAAEFVAIVNNTYMLRRKLWQRVG